MNASNPAGDPASFLAVTAALHTIDRAVRTARTPTGAGPEGGPATSEQALAALLLLRELRDQLAEWEPGLIETARAAGTSWADLAYPLGVASRQAAERRYLRVRPGAPGSTGEQRVQAARTDRAADRTITAWARDNAANLRQLAGQVSALTDLPAHARAPLADALADDDPTNLITPLANLHIHLKTHHPGLADRVNTLTLHTDQLRQDHQNAT